MAYVHHMHIFHVVCACRISLVASQKNVSSLRKEPRDLHSTGRSLPQTFGSQSATNVSPHVAHFGRNQGAVTSTIKRPKWLATRMGVVTWIEKPADSGVRHDPFCGGQQRGTSIPYYAACVPTDYLCKAPGYTSRFDDKDSRRTITETRFRGDVLRYECLPVLDQNMLAKQPQFDLTADRVTRHPTSSRSRIRHDLDRRRVALGHEIVNDGT